MKRNDDTIQRLFDDYAEDLTERSDLASKAKQELADRKANAKNAKKRKPNIMAWLVPICCAFLAVVVAVSVFAPSGESNDGNPNGGTQPPTTLTYYTVSQVTGRRIALSDCDDTLKISKLKQDENYDVVYERYYAFYFDDGTLAYIKCVLGVRSDEGFCEIAIIAEADGLVRTDLSDAYNGYIRHSSEAFMTTSLDDKGEYVTNAYFSARSSHFYIYAMTGANNQLAEKIISKIL